MQKATVTIWENPTSSGFPRRSWNVEVRKPNGGLIKGSHGFTDEEVAKKWGKGVAERWEREEAEKA